MSRTKLTHGVLEQWISTQQSDLSNQASALRLSVHAHILRGIAVVMDIDLPLKLYEV